MKIGSLVVCIYQFSREKGVWNFEYPNKGDVLTIKTIIPHHRHDFNMLTFEEFQTVPLCADRFREIKSDNLMDEVKEIISNPKHKGITEYSNPKYELL